jgi:hypothetical protein
MIRTTSLCLALLLSVTMIAPIGCDSQPTRKDYEPAPYAAYEPIAMIATEREGHVRSLLEARGIPFLITGQPLRRVRVAPDARADAISALERDSEHLGYWVEFEVR